MCLGDKLERGGRESTVETAKNHFFFCQNEGSGNFYLWKIDPLASGASCMTVSHPADISNFGLFWSRFERIFECLSRLELN